MKMIVKVVILHIKVDWTMKKVPTLPRITNKFTNPLVYPTALIEIRNIEDFKNYVDLIYII